MISAFGQEKKDLAIFLSASYLNSPYYNNAHSRGFMVLGLINIFWNDTYCQVTTLQVDTIILTISYQTHQHQFILLTPKEQMLKLPTTLFLFHTSIKSSNRINLVSHPDQGQV